MTDSTREFPHLTPETSVLVLDPEPVGKRCLTTLGVTTIQELLDCDVSELGPRPGYGQYHLRVVRELKELARALLDEDFERARELIAPPPRKRAGRRARKPARVPLVPFTCDSTEDFLEKIPQVLNETAYQILIARYWEGELLRDIAQRMDISHERVRQIEMHAVKDLNARLDVTALAEPLIKALETGGLVSFDRLPELGNGFEAPAEAQLLLDVAEFGPVYIREGRFLSVFAADQLSARLSALRTRLLAKPIVEVPWSEVLAAAREELASGLGEAELRWLLSHKLSMKVISSGLSIRGVWTETTDAARLVVFAERAAQPVMVEEMLPLFDGPLSDDLPDPLESAKALSKKEKARRLHAIVARLYRRDDMVRVDTSTYLHRNFLPWDEEELHSFVRWAEQRLGSADEPVCARALLQEFIHENDNDHLADVGWQCAKWFLLRSPNIRGMGNQSLVKWHPRDSG